jgi:hypothetical protein
MLHGTQFYTVLDYWNPDVTDTLFSRAAWSRDGSNPNESRQQNKGVKPLNIKTVKYKQIFNNSK